MTSPALSPIHARVANTFAKLDAMLENRTETEDDDTPTFPTTVAPMPQHMSPDTYANSLNPRERELANVKRRLDSLANELQNIRDLLNNLERKSA